MDVVVIVGRLGIDKFQLVAGFEKEYYLTPNGRAFPKVGISFDDRVLCLRNAQNGEEGQQSEEEESLHDRSW